jgi:3-isopropylmalate/(R)-2-methylmalate dehydratase small subunit
MWHNGTTWFFGDDVDTDQIMPTRYLALRTAEDLGKHALSGVDPSWPERIKPGEIVVGGWNFGCGSSREHAPLGLKGLGLACVVAKSFSRIFYRNAINIGLPLLVLKEEIADRKQGRRGWVDVEKGQLSFDGGDTVLQGIAPAPVVLDILSHGGLMHYVAKRSSADAAA